MGRGVDHPAHAQYKRPKSSTAAAADKATRRPNMTQRGREYVVATGRGDRRIANCWFRKGLRGWMSTLLEWRIVNRPSCRFEAWLRPLGRLPSG
jgi:hypothetical protein